MNNDETERSIKFLSAIGELNFMDGMLCNSDFRDIATAAKHMRALQAELTAAREERDDAIERETQDWATLHNMYNKQVAQLEKDGVSFSREECRALLADLSIVGRPTQREALRLWPARQSAISKLKGVLTDE